MEDTIAAVATAYGEGGIGIIRISGEKISGHTEERVPAGLRQRRDAPADYDIWKGNRR